MEDGTKHLMGCGGLELVGGTLRTMGCGGMVVSGTIIG